MFSGEGNWNWADGSMDGDVIAHEYVTASRVGSPATATTRRPSRPPRWERVERRHLFMKWNDSVVGEYVTDSPNTGVRSVNYASSPLAVLRLQPGRGLAASERRDLGLGDLRHPRDWWIDFRAQLLLDGMKATTDDPTFLDARDGIIAADEADPRRQRLPPVADLRGRWASPRTRSPTSTPKVPSECIPEADAAGRTRRLEALVT